MTKFGGGGTMDTQWKQVKRLTLGSVKTLEGITTRMEGLRDVEAILSQIASTNLESVMLCWGYSVSPGIIQFPGLRITPYWRYQSTYLRTLYCTHTVSVLTSAQHHRLARP
jgi:hypothetical protein